VYRVNSAYAKQGEKSMSYNKRYKIMDVMINKQLRGDEIVLKCVSSGGNKNSKSRMTLVKLAEMFIEFRNEQRKHNTRIELTLKDHGDRISKLENRRP
jgi:hypothetical protein